MTMTPGETPDPAAQGETPDEQPEEQFDLDRAMRTIRSLRSEAKAAKAQLKELESLRSEREEARSAQLSKEERLAQELARAQAERDYALTEAKDRALEYAIERAAAKAGIIDPDAARALLDRSQLAFDDQDRPTNVDALLADLAKAKPYLVAQAPSTAPSVSMGNSATRAPRTDQQTYTRAQLADRAFYEAHREDLKRAMAEGRIVQ